MNLTRVALTVGLACVAANLLMKSRRGEAGERDDGLGPFPSVDPGLPGRVRAMTSGAGGLAADDDDGSWTRGLFDSTSQESAVARAPALPDFARGA